MTGYVRKDTSNNIADGNIINAADLDAEFDGVQDAFNSSTGHKHDGTSGEGAPITVVGPVQDVVISATAITPKTTNTVDIGSSSLKFKDFYLAGNANIAGNVTLGDASTDTVTVNGGMTFGSSVTETVYALGTSGTIALDPANGTIQTCAAAGNITFTDSLSSGQSISLRLTSGSSYTITWPTMTWVTSAGNTAPTLTANDTLVFWKISTTLYGAYVGSGV